MLAHGELNSGLTKWPAGPREREIRFLLGGRRHFEYCRCRRVKFCDRIVQPGGAHDDFHDDRITLEGNVSFIGFWFVGYQFACCLNARLGDGDAEWRTVGYVLEGTGAVHQQRWRGERTGGGIGLWETGVTRIWFLNFVYTEDLECFEEGGEGDDEMWVCHLIGILSVGYFCLIGIFWGRIECVAGEEGLVEESEALYDAAFFDGEAEALGSDLNGSFRGEADAGEKSVEVIGVARNAGE